MAIIIVTATKNATTKGQDYAAVIWGVLKTEGSAVSAPDNTSFESHRPFLSTSTGAVESQRVLTFRSLVVETTCKFGSWPGCGRRPPDNRLARFSAIFHITKSGNYPFRYRNFAEFRVFLKKSQKIV
jgi:hypothetical protein